MFYIIFYKPVNYYLLKLGNPSRSDLSVRFNLDGFLSFNTLKKVYGNQTQIYLLLILDFKLLANVHLKNLKSLVQVYNIEWVHFYHIQIAYKKQYHFVFHKLMLLI